MGGAGATVPLLGFGCTLAEGVRQAVAQQGLLGAFTGGVRAAAGGISAAVFFGPVHRNFVFSRRIKAESRIGIL